MIKIAILGCGTIGSGVYEVIEGNQKEVSKEIGEEIRVAKILDLREFPGTPYEKLVVHDIAAIADDPEIELVVETMGGTNPVYQFVKACLLNGKHVVSSNKALVAAHGTELLEIAREKSVNFFFEAAVGGGIPLLRNLMVGYAGQKIDEIVGILNGTTNFILTKMSSEGADFDATLKEAQRLGYAERNPEADIEGHDTCRKIAILTSIASDAELNYETIQTEGITKIETADFLYAKKLDASIRLLGAMKRMDGQTAAIVAPFVIPNERLIASVSGVFNGVMIRGNMLGDSMVYGSGAGKLPTASAVIADIIVAMKNRNTNVPYGWHNDKLTLVDPGEVENRFLVRFDSNADEKQASEVLGGDLIRVVGAEGFAVCSRVMKEKECLAIIKELPGFRKFIRVMV